MHDALTADRPYREAMPTEKALDIVAAEVCITVGRFNFNDPFTDLKY